MHSQAGTPGVLREAKTHCSRRPTLTATAPGLAPGKSEEVLFRCDSPGPVNCLPFLSLLLVMTWPLVLPSEGRKGAEAEAPCTWPRQEECTGQKPCWARILTALRYPLSRGHHQPETMKLEPGNEIGSHPNSHPFFPSCPVPRDTNKFAAL